MEADSDWQDQNSAKNPQNGNNFRISNYSICNSYILCYEGKLSNKFKYENVIKMKNKPDPALSQSLYLFNEIKKRNQVPLKR
jgi:hypothetical protein